MTGPHRNRRITTSRIAARFVVSVGLALGCAVQVAPSGGPEDKTPPTVTSVSPAPDSTGVGTDAVLELTFSEGMNRTGIDRLVSFSPEVKERKVEWKGNTLRIVPRQPLHSDTTYVVTIKDGYRDAHNVSGTARREFAFATSAHIDSGSVSGRVFYRREPAKAAIVRCFVLPQDSGFAPGAARPAREVRTDALGDYRIGYLPTRGADFYVWAFVDKKANGRFDPDDEDSAALADTIRLTAAVSSASNRSIWIIDPDEPGKVAGRVTNATGIDTVAVTVGLFSVPDTAVAVYLGRCRETGDFEIVGVRAGRYLARAFLELQADSLCGDYPCGPDSTARCMEPCVSWPDTLVINPGDEKQLPPAVLNAAQTGKR